MAWWNPSDWWEGVKDIWEDVVEKPYKWFVEHSGLKGAASKAEQKAREAVGWIDDRTGATNIWREVNRAYDDAERLVSQYSGYDWMMEQDDWLKYAAGFGMFGQAFNYELYKDAVREAQPYAYKAGYWLGGNIEDEWLLAGAFMPGLAPLLGAGIGLDMYVFGGAGAQGYIDSRMEPEVDLTAPNQWNYQANIYDAYRWYPGSVEWDQSGAGGQLFNSTGLIEPWEMMNRRGQDVDNTGHLMDNFYDALIPAAPELTYAGAAGFDQIYGG